MYIINTIPVNISLPIRELLLHNQKAVIPGFGAFIMAHRPAELNKVTHVLTPPSVVIRFDNRQLADDGQLSAYLSQKLRLNTTGATEVIENFVKSSGEQLRTDGLLSLEGIGTITKDKAGEIIFKADNELLKLANLFELPKLGIQIAPPASTGVVVERPRAQSNYTYRERPGWVIPAVILALLAGFSAVVYFTGIYKNFMPGSKESAVVEPAGDSGKLVFGSRTASDSILAASDTLKEKISRELDELTARENALSYKEAEPKQEERKTSVPDQTVSASTGKPYHIISGAFLVPNNAERQKTVLEGKGINANLLPKKGNYFMVSVGSYDSHEQAVSAMRQLKSKLHQELWVMKM